MAPPLRSRSHSRARPRRSAASASAAAAARSAPARRRLAPEERRAQLVRLAAELITRRGVDAVQFAELAVRAGVTRQLVYRLFASRRALLVAVLEDFVRDVEARFAVGVAATSAVTLEDATRVFVEAVCDAIEANGAGPWELLGGHAPDPELALQGRRLLDRLVSPWLTAIGAATGATPLEVATVARMLVAAGRAVLEQWCRRALTREEAVRYTTRGVSALLEAFTVAPRRK